MGRPHWHGHGVTNDGLLFRETAREILALYQKALREDSGKEELLGDICLGMGETGSVQFMAEQIARFQERHPGMRFHLISENADCICEDEEAIDALSAFVKELGLKSTFTELAWM